MPQRVHYQVQLCHTPFIHRSLAVGTQGSKSVVFLANTFFTVLHVKDQRDKHPIQDQKICTGHEP